MDKNISNKKPEKKIDYDTMKKLKANKDNLKKTGKIIKK